MSRIQRCVRAIWNSQTKRGAVIITGCAAAGAALGPILAKNDGLAAFQMAVPGAAVGAAFGILASEIPIALFVPVPACAIHIYHNHVRPKLKKSE